MKKETEKKIRTRLEKGIQENVFPGAVVGILAPDGKRSFVSVGKFTYDAQSPEVIATTSYDVASITKSIPTGCITLALIEEGKLTLDDHITKFLPEYKNNYSNQVLIKHLLTYSVIVNFPIPGFTIEHTTPEEVRKNLLTTDLKFPPGQVVQYTNSPALLLTMVIERITNSRLDILADDYFFKPLGMDTTTFYPENPLAIPPTEIDEWRGLVQGVVHDETSYVLSRERPSGCAGLFSNAPDILMFLEMLLAKGSANGKKYFSPEMVEQMHTNQVAESGAFMGLGWELNEPRFMGTFAHDQMFGKTGFTGTACVLDPKRNIAFVMLSNRTYPKRSTPNAINEARRDISDIVFSTYE
jgi:CubicO group peptidase (beta-lactamase class C family)